MMKTILMGLLILFILGCEGKDMATIGVETNSTLIDTNVTDDTLEYKTTSLSAHGGRSSFIIKNNTLYATGSNSYGQLGLGNNTSVNIYTSTGITDVKSIICGEFHSLLIKIDGTLWVTGRNIYGALGLGDNTDRNIFTDTGIIGVESVAGGEFVSLLIKTNGTVWSTGYNSWGELGLGNSVAVNVFTDTGITSGKSVVVGRFHSLIIKDDNTLWSTGRNAEGQLGLGDNAPRNVFTDTGITSVESVAGGDLHSLIIKDDNTLWSTGQNLYGELGLGDNTNRNIFTNTGVSSIAVSGGQDFSQTIKTDGTLWGTGLNNFGQLGLSDNSNRNIFTDTSITDVIGVHCMEWDSVIIKNGNSIWGTGLNNSGQLGLSDNSNRNIFTDTSEIADAYIFQEWAYFYQGDIVKLGNFRYVTSLLGGTVPSSKVTLTEIGVVNELKPFDGQNITPAIFPSPMNYTIQGTEIFNSFTLAKVLASSVTYTFRLADTTIIKTDTVAIDCKRDPDGILSDYPTTVTFYAGQQMPIGSTVEISLTYSADIELGDFTLNNAIDLGFTNLAFSHGIKDFNNYTPDAWGQIAESVKAIVTTFQVSVDFPMTNYDYVVSFNESISGKNVTIDASDSNGAVADGQSVFASLTRRVRVTNPVMASNIKDNELGKIATIKLSVQEIV